jgi:hypothetical protein
MPLNGGPCTLHATTLEAGIKYCCHCHLELTANGASWFWHNLFPRESPNGRLFLAAFT